MRRHLSGAVFGICVVFLWGTLPAVAQLNGITIDTLTLDRAVAFALENNPSMRAAGASVSLAAANSRQTLGGYYPAISVSATASHTEGVFVFNPTIPARNQIYSSYSGGVQVNQLLYDFGRTSNRVAANGEFEDAAVADYHANRDLVVMNTELAFFNELEAERVFKVNEEAVAQAAKHLQQAKAFYSVGTRPKLDVTKGEVDLSNANVALITARNQLRVARVQLENAMGVHPSNEYKVSDSFSLPPTAMTLDSVETIAKVSRPDVISARLRFDAANSLVTPPGARISPR